MPTTPKTTGTILALDVGDKRVGVARASAVARLPEPLVTLSRGADFFPKLKRIIAAEAVTDLVVGLPRGLDGQRTTQTEATEAFVTELETQIELPVHLQDEALTSKKARAELAAGKKPYQRGDVDALAAVYILEDFLTAHPREVEV
ncbi:MAG TPA: Holliday junction resolvase RuvX [Candidatus Saccharimonadales bacterium]|nr:Holliday junction resolvase RuvX [Candidatus Saccharimonadales bacterium]